MGKEVENEQGIKNDSSVEQGFPMGADETEEVTDRIEDLVSRDDHPAAIQLFSELRPGERSEVLEDLSPELQQEILTALPAAEAADILEHLDPVDIARVSDGIEPAVLSDILDETDSDVTVDVLRHLSEERARDVLGEMEEAAEVEPLLQYADDSAGGRMALEYVAVEENATAHQALDTLRENEPDAEDLHSVFVVDAEKRLVGELSIVKLALARRGVVVKTIMNPDIVFVSSQTNQEECARVMEQYDLNQLPVVDEFKHLVGVIRLTDIIDVVEEEATEDMYRLVGIAGERLSGPLSASLRKRFPWLTLNLATTFLAALVISLFESTIAKVVVLAVFLPVVAGQGGIGGTQTLTLVIRSMALGEISRRGGLRLLGREITLGLVHGLLLGAIVGVAAYFWKGSYMLGVVLALAMAGNMIIAGLAGAGVPLLLARLRVDPAVASAVIVTTCTDVLGFLLFLGLATALVTSLL